MGSAEQSVIRRRMQFYGWVQGVGFRWRARAVAEKFGHGCAVGQVLGEDRREVVPA